jgi:hypothetical protein
MTHRRGLAAVAASALMMMAGGSGTGGVATAGDGDGLGGTALRSDQVGYRGIQQLSITPHTGPFVGQYGTDIAFQGTRAYVGNYQGFITYDISNPRAPVTLSQVNCPGAQNDVTISGDLLYLSTDSSRSDDSCASTPLPATNTNAWEGIKIFDVSDPRSPRYVKSVETQCGSHTHSLVPGRGADYLYVSSYAPNNAFPDCTTPHDLISIVKVPATDPTAASVVAAPNVFPDGGNPGGVTADGNAFSATSGCHDITVYPARRIAAGACMGDGVIFDISDPEAPRVIETVRDTTNFAFWHSATFNNTGTKVVFTDELGGGGAATCNEAVGPTQGANAIYDLSRDNQLTKRSYYKIPRAQFDTENCVAHNGSIVPVRGRDVMVQAWYQGGVSLWEFTDSGDPREIGWFERGPLEPATVGGSWSAYYYNGFVYSSDIQKGLDVLRITTPSLRKAGTVRLDRLNPQSQPIYPTR